MGLIKKQQRCNDEEIPGKQFRSRKSRNRFKRIQVSRQLQISSSFVSKEFFIITSNLNSYEVNLQVQVFGENQISVVISPFISFLILTIIGIHHLMYPTSNSISMYLFGTVCCQHIHPSQNRRWILICTHHFDFDIRFLPISALMLKTLHQSRIEHLVLSVICVHKDFTNPKTLLLL